jgi:hypothetical protein
LKAQVRKFLIFDRNAGRNGNVESYEVRTMILGMAKERFQQGDFTGNADLKDRGSSVFPGKPIQDRLRSRECPRLPKKK